MDIVLNKEAYGNTDDLNTDTIYAFYQKMWNKESKEYEDEFITLRRCKNTLVAVTQKQFNAWKNRKIYSILRE